MEARPLLRMDESRYRRLRLEAAKESPLALTRELQRELDLIHAGQVSLLAGYATQGTRVWGAFDDFHLAGVVALSPIYADTDLQPLWLWGLHVQAKFRGTPASRLLMRAVQDWAEKQRPGSTTLATYHRDNRRAQQLLDRFGFTSSDLGHTLLRSGVAGDQHVVVEYSNDTLPPRPTMA